MLSNMRKQHHNSVKEVRKNAQNKIFFKFLIFCQLLKKIKQVTQCHSEEGKPLKLMVVGMPNVGKSSLINALRRNYMGKGK